MGRAVQLMQGRVALPIVAPAVRNIPGPAEGHIRGPAARLIVVPEAALMPDPVVPVIPALEGQHTRGQADRRMPDQEGLHMQVRAAAQAGLRPASRGGESLVVADRKKFQDSSRGRTL